MTSASTLNPADYKTVWNDNFTKDTGFNRNIWTGVWGNSNDFQFNNNGLTITSYQSEGWSNAGFIQPDGGASQSQGYGLYSATASVPANQGVGICIVMWPSDNVWPGAEIDLLENWSDPSSQTGYCTIHWKGPGNSNGQDPHQFSIDLTKSHTYAVDWQANALTYYIDNQQIFQVTGSEVPKDAAHGGVNEAFGAEVTAAATGPQPTNQVSLTISDMSYSTYVGGGTAGGTATISVSAPGALQEASVGAGVNVIETVTANGVSTVYEAVFTAANVAEANWQAVSLNSSGFGSFSAHFQHSGDYIVAINDPTTQTVKGWSTPVTITDAAAPPTNVKLTGDNLYTNSKASTVIGTLSATDSNPLSFALSSNPGNYFAINGGQLVLAKDAPATSPKSVKLSVIATDTVTHLSTTQIFTVGVNTPVVAAAAISASFGQITPASVQFSDIGHTDRMIFIGPAAAGPVAGTDQAVIVGDNDGNIVTFGTGPSDVWGGTGADNFVFHAGDELQVVENFSATKGDVLTIDHSLHGMLRASTAAGGTMLSFGDSAHGTLLAGLSSFNTNQIRWG